MKPDPSVAAQRVAFGTSGHRGSSFDGSFNEGHVLAITQAICEYRKAAGHRRPAVPRHRHARAVAAGLRQRAGGAGRQRRGGARSRRAANTRRRRRSRTRSWSTTAAARRAGRRHRRSRPRTTRPTTAASSTTRPMAARPTPTITGWIQERANALLEGGLKDVRRVPLAQARSAATTREHDYLGAYVADLGNVLDFDLIRGVRHPHGRGSARRRRRALLGAHRRALPPRPRRGQRAGRSDLLLHDAWTGTGRSAWIRRRRTPCSG